MKKGLLSTVALIAFAAPAAAADLAARPYVKAPPAPIAIAYDWSGFYLGANGGWDRAASAGISGPTSSVLSFRPWPKAATMQPAAPSVARSVIAGRPALGCSALKRRATGPISAATM